MLHVCKSAGANPEQEVKKIFKIRVLKPKDGMLHKKILAIQFLDRL